jgi:hypothetical protein
MSLESIFPRLSLTPYRVTSPSDPLYNCFAWAGGESHRWWEPIADAGYYWPIGPTDDWSVDVVVAAFRALGYEVCADGQLEPEAEKVAIYVRGDEPTHAARQVPSGVWTSKLGPEQDIEHTLDGLAGSTYGMPSVFLNRAIERA